MLGSPLEALALSSSICRCKVRVISEQPYRLKVGLESPWAQVPARSVFPDKVVSAYFRETKWRLFFEMHLPCLRECTHISCRPQWKRRVHAEEGKGHKDKRQEVMFVIYEYKFGHPIDSVVESHSSNVRHRLPSFAFIAGGPSTSRR